MTKMKRTMATTVLAAVVVIGALVARPGAAHACGGGYNYGGLALLAVGALAVGVADVGLTGADLIHAGMGKSPGRIYGGAELALTAPQAVLFGALAVNSLRSNDGDAGLWMPLTVWTGALAVHGIWALTHPADRPSPSDPDEPKRHARATVQIAPTLVSANGRDSAPGAVLFGRF